MARLWVGAAWLGYCSRVDGTPHLIDYHPHPTAAIKITGMDEAVEEVGRLRAALATSLTTSIAASADGGSRQPPPAAAPAASAPAPPAVAAAPEQVPVAAGPARGRGRPRTKSQAPSEQ